MDKEGQRSRWREWIPFATGGRELELIAEGVPRDLKWTGEGSLEGRDHHPTPHQERNRIFRRLGTGARFQQRGHQKQKENKLN